MNKKAVSKMVPRVTDSARRYEMDTLAVQSLPANADSVALRFEVRDTGIGIAPEK